MKKRMMMTMLGCFAVGGTILSACSAAGSQKVIPEVIQVQTVPSQGNKISLTSSEVVKVVPDMAEISLTVRTEDSSASVCQQKNTERLNQLLSYIKELEFEDDSIKTSGFSLNPRYQWTDNEQKLVGYEMRTSVVVTDIPMELVGRMLSEAVEHGANEIDSVSYFSSQYDQAYNQALTKAVELSRAKGEALALASGKKLGEVLNIEEMSDKQYGRYVNAELSSANGARKQMAMAESMDMDVMPGEMQVTAEIAVEFELVDAE